MRSARLFEELASDIAYAVRLLKKSPGFTLTAIGTLALGIGANTAIFGLVNATLLRPLPFDRPERLMTLFERGVGNSDGTVSVAPGNFLDWRATATSFDSVSALTMRAVTLSGDGSAAESQRVTACVCSGNLMATLGVAPIAGRAFRAEEDRSGAEPVVVIGYDLWQRQFGGAPALVGRPIRLNDQDYHVIGVMPRGFTFPSRAVDLWLPMLATMTAQQQVRHDLHFLSVIGRLRTGVSPEQARAEIDGITARYKNAHPGESAARGATLVPMHEDLVRGVRTPLLVLLGAVSCVLLIACVNIANLMLTRAAGRSREVGIRIALGATRGRLVRQLMTESLVLGLAGGATGAIVATWIAGILITRAPGAADVLEPGSTPIDPAAFAFALAMALVTGLVVGLLPAIRSSRSDVTSALKDQSRAATAGRGQGRVRDALVTAEVALSLMLLVAAGLLLHSFSRLYDVQTGVRMDHTITFSTMLPAARYREPAQRSARFAELGERLRNVPGVKSAGLVSCPPLTGACNVLFFYIEGRPFEAGRFLTAYERTADPGYFTAAGIPLLRGRTFSREEGVGFDPQHPRTGTIVISESMAKTYFPGDDPIGKRIFFDFELQREHNEGIPTPRYEIVGVVGDVVPALADRIGPTLYRSLYDSPGTGTSVLLHTAVEPAAVMGAVREEIRRFDGAMPLYLVRTMDELLGRSTADRRFTMLLVASFAALAVVLAAIGLYGVVSYGVSQRTAEIGIRMALGATSADVNRLIVVQGLKPALAGVVLGLAAAALASRVLQTLLFGVVPLDPLTFSLVPPLLLSIAALACYGPAARATRIDPTKALRSE